MISWFFFFESGISGQISALMLEPFTLNKVAEFICADPDSGRLILRKYGSNSMFRVMTIHSIDLLYFTHGTRRY